MSAPKPIGFDNWKKHHFVTKDGSGNGFWIKASFSVELSGKHLLFRGPSIASVTASPTITTIVTSEPHGFHTGQRVRLNGLPFNVADALNDLHTVTVVSPDTFTVEASIDGETVPLNVGIAGVDVGANFVTTEYAMTPGRLCIEDYPEAWEEPWEG